MIFNYDHYWSGIMVKFSCSGGCYFLKVFLRVRCGFVNSYAIHVMKHVMRAFWFVWIVCGIWRGSKVLSASGLMICWIECCVDPYCHCYRTFTIL